MRFPLLALLLLAATSASAQTGTLTGQVLEADGVTSVIGSTVRVEGTTLGTATDIDGNYRIIGVPVGTYTVTASYAGYTSESVQGVGVSVGATRWLNFALNVGDYPEYRVCFCDASPMITNDAIGQSRILTGQDVENMPVNR